MGYVWVRLLEITAKYSMAGQAGRIYHAGEPRTSGDGYFESVVLDPDGNRIECVYRKTANESKNKARQETDIESIPPRDAPYRTFISPPFRRKRCRNVLHLLPEPEFGKQCRMAAPSYIGWIPPDTSFHIYQPRGDMGSDTKRYETANRFRRNYPRS